MKKIYLLLVLLLQLIAVENSIAQCTHTIALTDTYGDGWNGGAVSVSVNGTVVLTNITLGTGFGPANFNFTASAGQTIRVYTTIAGSWAGERRIRVVNNTGVEVIALVGVANGTATSGGRVGTAVCAAAPPPCASNNVNLSITAGAYPGEVSWTLVNPSGTTVASGGAPYNQNLCLPTGCYTFNMIDSWGDGWNGANYTFTLGGSSIGTGTLGSGASGSAQIGIGTSCAPPAYNPCTTIPTISGCGTSATANMTGAGAGWSPGSCGFTTPGQERLFSFTAPTTGTYQLNVSAITGGYVDFFWKAASGGCNATGWNCIDDIFGAGTYNAVTPMTFTAGTTYYILLDPEQTSATSATFNMVCPVAGPANDLVCNAASITCGGTVSGTTVGAGNAGTGENQTCGIGQTMGGVWYVVPGNGQIMTASLCGTVWDSKISVFSGTNCSTLTCVGGNDDAGPACATTSASFSWTSVVGQNYYILVHGYSSNAAFSLALTCAAPPPADPTGITSSNASICSGAGTNVTLTATGASGTVYWFTGTCATTGQIGTGNSIIVSPSTTTTYFARNFNGSAFSNNCASFTLTVNSLPTINAGTDGTICLGSNLQLNATSSSQSNGTLSTIFTGGNGCGAGNMFDLVAGPAPVTVNGFTLNPAVTGAQTVNVYYRVGTHVGNTTNSAAWTLLGAYTLNGTIATPSYMATGNIIIPSGATYGIYVQYNANYTDGNGTNQTYSNANLTLNAGVGHCAGFDGCCAPRVFNGIVHYTVGSNPTFSWSPSASLSSSSIINPVATPATTTTYTVTATANGCSASDAVVVNVSTPSSGTSPVNGDVIWRGATSIDWATPSNWYFYNGSSYSVAGVSPNSTTRTIIPSNQTCVTQQPSVAAGTTVNAKDVVIESGATLTMTTGTLNVNGNFTNNGTFVAGTGTVVFNTAATVSGNATTFNNVDLNNGVNFGNNLSTINGIMTMNTGSWVNTNAPIYGTSSLLRYNTGGAYGRGFEWSTTSGAGYPNDVQVSNNTTINYPNTGGAFSTNLGVRRDLTIDAGSNVYMDYGTGNASGSLTVGRNVTSAGDLSLGNQIGGDIYVGGNWTRTTGNFYANNRAVFFNGATGAQTITNSGGETFPFMIVNKASGNVVLANNVTVWGGLTLTNGLVEVGTNNMVMGGASLTGGSSASYVKTESTGVLSRNVAGTATTFPVGNGTYNPAMVTNTGIADIFTIRVIDNVTANGTGVGATTTEAVVNRTWMIDEATAGGTNATLRLFWNGAGEEINAFSAATAFMAHYVAAASLWDNIGGTVGAGYVETSNNTSFSPFTISSSTTFAPLPVELISLGAQCANEDVIVSWSTASEHNSLNFIVERSENGLNWNEVQTVTAAVNSNTVREYAIEDAGAARGLKYYRLIQTDQDGAQKVYGPVMSNCGSDADMFMSFPNPSDADITLVFNSKKINGSTTLMVRDAHGRVVRSMSLEIQPGTDSMLIPDMELTPGVYYLQLEGESFKTPVIKHSLR